MTWRLEPVRILAIARAVIVLLAAFGFQLSAEQTAAIYLVLELVFTEIARAQVSPKARDVGVPFEPRGYDG